MSRIDDLIDALNRNADLMEEERLERANARNDRIANATASLAEAQENRDAARRSYKLARVGNLLGLALIPVGVLALAGSMVGGFAPATADFLSGAGVLTAALGGILKFFLCSKERVKVLKDRAQKAENQVDEIEDYLNNI